MAKFYFMKNSTRVQMLGIVIITENNKVIIFDGGMEGDSCHLAEIIGGRRVDAWFFTHQHCDHTGAFCDLIRNNNELEIEYIYHAFPTLDDLEAYGSKSPRDTQMRRECAQAFEGRYKNCTHYLEAGEVFDIDDVRVRVLRAYDPDIKANFENNSSVVYRVDGKKASVLILGDLGAEGGDDTLAKCDYEDLKTDYVQLAHHGQQAVKRDFYEFIKPVRCLWATPDWLWDNDEGNGFNTGPYETIHSRKMMDELGVKENIVTKDGTAVFEI